MEIIPATAEQRAEIGAARDALERYVRGAVTNAIVQRWAFWRSLEQSGAARAAAPLAGAHAAADEDARRFAGLLRGLNTGALELVPWAEPREQGYGTIRLGVARTGALGLFQLVPVLIIAAAAAVASGVFVLADLWLEARKLEAEASNLRAKTAAQITSTVAQVAQQDPHSAAALADALARANQAATAARPSLLDQLVGAIGTALPSSSGLGWLGWAALAWLFLRRRSAT